ncbi:heavy-metal-associated domain-containing protein [Prevotella dentasini]|uniref:heavy-metal-associated domain-containing protein n=1 Tax=Prevotella dentasini TaxID=589537 RepID=UPI0004691137|nr:heavy metal-associated domain-containing protein [Prevotella dentasini]
MKKSILTMLLAMAAIAVSAKDIKTVVFTTTPQMHCESCENKIKGNLRFEKGVKEIKTDVEEQKVYVTYDADKTTEEKLRQSFEKFGYKAEKTTKDAKVPVHEGEECSNM